MLNTKIELDRARVAIVMPVFNEGDGIEEFLRELERDVSGAVGELTLVVVDDCSTDATPAVLDRVMKSMPGLVHSRAEQNRGHGPTSLAAYRRGLADGAEIVVHVDGDGQFLGDDIMKVVRQLADGYDAVVGVREGRTDPWFRKAISLSLKVYLYLLARFRSRDPNCPLRGYRRETLALLLARFPTNPMVPSVYLTVLERRLDVNLLHLPVRSLPRRGTTKCGSTWGTTRAHMPPRRLLKFVVAAARESLCTIPRLGGQRNGATRGGVLSPVGAIECDSI